METIYNNTDEVLQPDSEFSEMRKNRAEALKDAIDEGIGSGVAVGFDPRQHLRTLKMQQHNG